MLRKGDMVRPRVHRKRYRGGTLAIVISIENNKSVVCDLQILWLDGDFRGEKIWDFLDLFEKVTERNHA